MHPIEHLRYVARSRGIDDVELVREAAIALASIRGRQADIVIACRRMIERHPTAAAMWWLAARMLDAGDPRDAAWQVIDELESDQTSDLLAAHAPLDAIVIYAVAACQQRLLVPAGTQVALAALGDSPVWCAVTVGRRLPSEYVDRILEHGHFDQLTPSSIECVVTSQSVSRDVVAALMPECACAPELLRVGAP